MTNIIEEIRTRPKPLDIASWWKRQPPTTMASPLDEEERGYLEFFTSSEVQPIMRVGRGIANPANLNREELARAEKWFAASPTKLIDFVNYENRRRIVAHYALIHPATIQYELGLYRLSRDVNPATFVAERIYQLFTGEEAFTGQKISRLRAGVELLIPIVIGGILRFARPAVLPRPLAKPLDSPIYDLPPEGGMMINGRWYTEHALERMAPDTPQIRAELVSRISLRLQKLGINPGSEAWGACYGRALQKIDPRGIPPRVVEAEITSPGSTNVRVITARGKSVVVTVMPRH